MKSEQLQWTADSGWQGHAKLGSSAQLVLAFGGVDEIHHPDIYGALRLYYPKADIISVSTAGEICESRVQDHSVISTAIQFEHTATRLASLDVVDYDDSFKCGQEIQRLLIGDNLAHIMILSEGTQTNGDELVRGINSGLPENVIVTGGLAADAGRFARTYVGVNETARPGRIAAVGLYGSRLQIGHGSRGGWDEFGPVRIVTHSQGNILFSLDGTPALELYKKYLGPKATELPGAALLFPLCILRDDGSQLVRTILSINETEGTMTFAGDIPQGSRVQFMMANFDRLVEGATIAAEENNKKNEGKVPQLVMMVSCVGRKIVLDQRVEEEVENVFEVFGDGPTYFGFYSNGEISPIHDTTACSLHNQTMTITSYCEV